MLIELPCLPGEQHAFFRDVTDKHEPLCNVIHARRLLPGNTLRLRRIELAVVRYDGDDVSHLLNLYGTVEVKLNRSVLLSRSAHNYLSVDFVASDTSICDNDDIKGQLTICAPPPSWGSPKLTEYVEKAVTTEEQLRWPEWLHVTAHKLGVPLPYREKTVTRFEQVSRPVKGRIAVTLRLIGDGTEPVGK